VIHGQICSLIFTQIAPCIATFKY